MCKVSEEAGLISGSIGDLILRCPCLCSELEYLITASTSANGSAVLQVLPEVAALQGASFFESEGILSSYCRGSISNICELLVLGNSTTLVYTVFVPLDNGVWILSLSFGPSVEKVGESTLVYHGCRTVGVFEVYESFIAVCTTYAFDDLHYCDLSVDLTNASSTVNHCGEVPGSLHASLVEGRISNVIQTGTRFSDTSLDFFSGTTLYQYFVDTSRIRQIPLAVDCEIVTRVLLLQRSTGSVYLHCNNTKIYRYTVFGSSSEAVLVRDALEQSYPCRNGSYSITGNEVLYTSPLGANLTLALAQSVMSGRCIADNSLVYEDVGLSINLINVGPQGLRLSVISSGNFEVLDNSYVAQFDRGTIVITEPTTQAISEFMTSSNSFPPLIFLLTILVEANDVTTIPNHSMTMETSTLLPTTPTTHTEPSRSTHSVPLSTAESPTSSIVLAAVLGVVPFVVVVVVVVVLALLIIVYKLYKGSVASPTQHQGNVKLVGQESRTALASSEEESVASPSEVSDFQNQSNIRLDSQREQTTDLHEGEQLASPVNASDQSNATMVGFASLASVSIEAVRENIQRGETEDGRNDRQSKINYCNQ